MDKSANVLLFCFNRNIPLAIIISMPIITILYLMVNVSYFSVMSMEDLLNSPAVGIVSVLQNYNTLYLKINTVVTS